MSAIRAHERAHAIDKKRQRTTSSLMVASQGTRRGQPAQSRIRRPLQAALFLMLAFLLCAAAPATADDSNQPWILVDTEARRLDVYRGYTLLKRFRNVALGSGGPAPLHLEGDATTPLGEFRILHVNHDSRFHIFLGLDYPTAAHMNRAREQGLIDAMTHEMFMSTASFRRTPPQDTPLGGHIGIHGIGSGDPDIHARFDWTRGCIALTNEQIEELSRLIRPGARVFIR
jgi:murein L,D-transpeptidase YafK